MASVIVPVVVIGMPVVGELDLRGAARGVMNVVVGECHLVVLSVTEPIKEQLSETIAYIAQG